MVGSFFFVYSDNSVIKSGVEQPLFLWWLQQVSFWSTSWRRRLEQRPQQEAERPIRKIFGPRAAASQQHTGVGTGTQQGCVWIFPWSAGPGESPCAYVKCLFCIFPFLSFSINSRPGCGAVDISEVHEGKFSEKRLQPQQSFEVNGSASLTRLATSRTIKPYLYGFRPRPHPRVSCGTKRSHWWTAFGVDISNLGRRMCFGVGR